MSGPQRRQVRRRRADSTAGCSGLGMGTREEGACVAWGRRGQPNPEHLRRNREPPAKACCAEGQCRAERKKGGLGPGNPMEPCTCCCC